MAIAEQKTGESESISPVEPKSPSIREKVSFSKSIAKATVKNSRFFDNTRGYQNSSNMMDKGVNLVVGILVVGLLAAYLLPVAIDEITAVDTSAWGGAEAALFGLLPIFLVLGIVLFVVNKAT